LGALGFLGGGISFFSPPKKPKAPKDSPQEVAELPRPTFPIQTPEMNRLRQIRRRARCCLMLAANILGIYTHLHMVRDFLYFAQILRRWFTQILHRKIGVKLFLSLGVKGYSHLK